MLRAIFSGSAFFAVSVLLFSFIRQIIVFPAISFADDVAFAELTFVIFTVEAIAYGFIGALPDYYLRNVSGKFANPVLYKFLRKLSLLSLIAVAPLFFLGVDIVSSTIMAIYLCVFSLNALSLKLLFSAAGFSENYIYMAFRSMPYLVLLYAIGGVENLIQGNEVLAASVLLLFFEFFYLCRLVRQMRKKVLWRSDCCESHLAVGVGKVLPFMLGALMLGFLQRGDLTAVKVIDSGYYAEYAKLILTINFFCAPLVLMISSPLLTFLSKSAEYLSKDKIRKIIIVCVIAIFITGFMSSLLFDYIYTIIYAAKNSFSPFIIFYVVVCNLLYALMRTFVVRYGRVNEIIFFNFSAIVIILVASALLSVQAFVLFFYGVRLVAQVVVYCAASQLRRC